MLVLYYLHFILFVFREQILDKRQASLIVRAGVQIYEQDVTLKVIEDTRVLVTCTDLKGVETTKTFENISLEDDKDCILNFRVPVDCVRISSRLTGRIKKQSTGKYQNVSNSWSCSMNSIVQTTKIADTHLLPQQQG